MVTIGYLRPVWRNDERGCEVQVLQLDLTGQPQDFITVRDAALAYANGSVCWTVGEPLCVLRGGVNVKSGMPSRMEIHPIIAMRSASRVNLHDHTPGLTNRKLFRRDRMTCCWCGRVFAETDLTREHIFPRVLGGLDIWQNCASACKRCNGFKGRHTMEELGWQLVYLPFVPNRWEDMILRGRNIRADVHEFLSSRLPKGSRLN
jgi:5-methylcytosine-specific restriction endonuclease McrA